jgi:dimethylhistidine N-methyltransferase
MKQPHFIQNHVADDGAARAELIAGLLRRQAEVAPKYFYDSLGSKLFEAITELPEYYPTRTEAALFQAHGAEMAQAIGPGATLIDLGAGNCEKALRLFPVLQPGRYVAVDISVSFLREALQRVQNEHPGLDITGLGVDFSAALTLPTELLRGRPVFFYPGSSIGNFTPHEASRLLSSVREQARGGGLLIGVDLRKPAHVLEAAYDDALGVTAAFNRNALRNINAALGSDFDPAQWDHAAVFDAGASRIEMHLKARQALTVQWPGGRRSFEAGESLHTENSYKYTVASFTALLQEAGFRAARQWVDPQEWFAVFWAQA